MALAYKTTLKERGLPPATINRRLAALRSLVKLGRTLGVVPWGLEIRNERTVPFRDTRGPGADGLRRMLEATREAGGRKGARDQALLRLLHDLALRASEVVSLDVDDVDLERASVAVVGKGTSEPQLLSLPEPTCQALAEWLDHRGVEAGPLFLPLGPGTQGDRPADPERSARPGAWHGGPFELQGLAARSPAPGRDEGRQSGPGARHRPGGGAEFLAAPAGQHAHDLP